MDTRLEIGESHLHARTYAPLAIAPTFSIHLHVRTYPFARKIAPPSFWRTKTPGEVAALMAMLFAHNYVLIDRRDNEACSHCSEIVLADICTRKGDRTAT